MPDIFYLVRKWGKQILLVVILSVLVVGVVTFLKPVQYLAVATSVPASSFSADRSKIFSDNIQALYSTLGTPDDLDMILGTAQLDTVYESVTDQFNLYDHYKFSDTGMAARARAASRLKKNTRVMKSGFGELKVKVWDTGKNLSAQLANAIMDKLQSIHQHLQSQGNSVIFSGLKNGKERISLQVDSIRYFLSTANMPAGGDDAYTKRLNILTSQLSEYDKLINEYELMVISKPPVLITVEKAKAPQWPDRPKKVQVILATLVLSFLFSLLLVLVLERNKLNGRDPYTD